MIITNAARCLRCKDIIVSRSRHDYQACSCDSIFVDGGKDYLRRGGSVELLEDLSVSVNEPFKSVSTGGHWRLEAQAPGDDQTRLVIDNSIYDFLRTNDHTAVSTFKDRVDFAAEVLNQMVKVGDILWDGHWYLNEKDCHNE